MYLRSLAIENVRAFKTANIELLYPGGPKPKDIPGTFRWPPRLPNVNVFLGINGSGKSTVLDAIALVLLSPVITSTGYNPYALIRRSNRGQVKTAHIGAELVLHSQDVVDAGSEHSAPERVDTIIERRGTTELIRSKNEFGSEWEWMFNETMPGAFFVVGYGATRWVGSSGSQSISAGSKPRGLRYRRVASLFEDHLPLIPLTAWLPDQNKKRTGEVIDLINKLLPSGLRMTGALDAEEYEFRHRTVAVPFRALSDGYQAYIGWVSDLIYNLANKLRPAESLIDIRGVVLVDEVDLHIHPGWQLTMIPRLAKTFPKLQFIFTTHSPLIVGTLERVNIHRVELNHSGLPTIRRPDEETLGLSADQILRSDAFGLSSTRDREFSRALAELQKRAADGEAGAAIAFMRKAALGAAEARVEPPMPAWLKQRTPKA